MSTADTRPKPKRLKIASALAMIAAAFGFVIYVSAESQSPELAAAIVTVFLVGLIGFVVARFME